MMDSMPLRVTVIVLSLGLAIALLVRPSMFPGAQGTRIPVVAALALLALLNVMRILRSRQAAMREERLSKIPKNPLGL
jgi:hypothetical protein